MDIVARLLKKKEQLSLFALKAFYYGYVPLLVVLSIRSMDFKAMSQGMGAQ